jgi:hypothetical protein
VLPFTAAWCGWTEQQSAPTARNLALVMLMSEKAVVASPCISIVLRVVCEDTCRAGRLVGRLILTHSDTSRPTVLVKNMEGAQSAGVIGHRDTGRGGGQCACAANDGPLSRGVSTAEDFIAASHAKAPLRAYESP